MNRTESFANVVATPVQACLVSVVVPNYNHGEFLPRCLAAIEAQTHRPYEVVLIDDASSDNSIEVIEQFSPRLPRFRLIRHDENLGVVAGMNEGLHLASGTHVLFAAADDWIEPDLIAESVRWLNRYPESGLCSALTRLADEKGAIAGPFRTPLPRWTAGYISPAEAVRQLANDDTWFNGNTTIVNRSAAIAAGGYRPELASFCDGFLNANLAWSHGACFIPRFLAVWRRLETGYAASVTANPDSLVKIFNAIRYISTGGDVPKQCSGRWSARWQFMAARGALEPCPEVRRQQLLSIVPANIRALVSLLEHLARIPLIGRLSASAFLFFLLRLRDIAPVARRRLEWIALGGILEARR